MARRQRPFIGIQPRKKQHGANANHTANRKEHAIADMIQRPPGKRRHQNHHGNAPNAHKGHDLAAHAIRVDLLQNARVARIGKGFEQPEKGAQDQHPDGVDNKGEKEQERPREKPADHNNIHGAPPPHEDNAKRGQHRAEKLLRGIQRQHLRRRPAAAQEHGNKGDGHRIKRAIGHPHPQLD